MAKKAIENPGPCGKVRAMDFEASFDEKLGALATEGLYRSLSPSLPTAFIHNDYLGLSKHPALIECGKKALEKWGAGSTGSRLLGGHSALFDEVEEKIADFFGSPTALFFSTGYMANIAAVTTLADHADGIYSDEKNHASWIDGIRLSSAPKTIVPHCQWGGDVLEIKSRRPLFVSETLFSMDGDLADLSTLWERQHQSGAFLLLDEAHAAGVFPLDGRGLTSLKARDWSRQAIVVTFGKAFGVAGAAVLCSAKVRELLINRARSFIYSTAPTPSTVAMVGEAVDLVREASALRTELWRRSREVRARLSAAQTLQTTSEGYLKDYALCSPIVPFFVRGEVSALSFCESMRRSGIDLRAIRYPTVARGSERIRISLHLGISWGETERIVSEVLKRWTEFSSQEPIRE